MRKDQMSKGIRIYHHHPRDRYVTKRICYNDTVGQKHLEDLLPWVYILAVGTEGGAMVVHVEPMQFRVAL